MSHAQKHLLFFIDCKDSPIPKQMSALGMSNLSQFTLLSHFCICLLKSPDTALYTLWSSSLLLNLKISPMRIWSNLHCSVWIILHFISVLKFQQSDEGRLFPCIFRSTVCLLGVLREIKRASVHTGQAGWIQHSLRNLLVGKVEMGYYHILGMSVPTYTHAYLQ